MGVSFGQKTGVLGVAENVIRPCKAVIRPCKPVIGIIVEKMWIGLLRFVRREENRRKRIFRENYLLYS